ncbi:ninein-like protein isoform X2 [Eublepharis macularius]|uniref:Ninein-like protein n=1 Tax=Eublepharis macularius TaxID=481883 RepID=A0AA97K803_EUBMA|nr:ninein-like protein isoform X2 [Eublepharis macularius]
MEEEENKYVSQLKDVYDSCDTTGTGYLDKEELTELCHKLHLERRLPLLLETLLGNNHLARVNFEEFKEGFVTVLSSSIDLGVSDDESSYLEPVVPDEVKPKYINGAKCYGRRTRPEFQDTKLETSKYLKEQQAKANIKSQLRRSASLESVESLKSDEDAESTKEPLHELFKGQGPMCPWDDDDDDSPRKASGSYFDMTENQVRDIWECLGIGNSGYLDKQELAVVCKNVGHKELEKEELEDLFNKLDSDGDGRVSFKEFHLGLFSHNPILCPVSSTPLKPKWQRLQSYQVFKEGHRSTTPSFLSGSVGLNFFFSIDDGTGFASPEQVVSIWAQEGVENCKEILKSLEFNMEEKVNLLELSVALDDELMASKSGPQQAAVASCRYALHYLQAQVEQISLERDKAKIDLEKAEKRNVQLLKEVDDHHSAMEYQNESKLKDLEQDYRGKLTVMKSEVEMEWELLLDQENHQRSKLEADIKSLQAEESVLREKLTLVIKENSRLQNEVAEAAQKLSESEKQVLKFQKDLDFMLKDKLGLLDPHISEISDQEERFAEIIKEYELQCRDLRDTNDELQMEVEKLRSQLQESNKHNRARHKMKAKKPEVILLSDNVGNRITDSLQTEGQLLGCKHVPVTGQSGATLVESDGYSVSIEMELLVEELKEQHQDLKIQLDTKVNYYEREIELMKRNFEKERKDIEQGFKIEISELEEQKNDLEELNVKCQEVIDGLKEQLQKLAPVQELEKKYEKEMLEMEQYYAKEISSLGQRLAQERDQLQEEMKMKHETEIHRTRIELHRVLEDNDLLKNKLGRLQQEVEDADEANKKHRKHIDEMKMKKEKARSEMEELNQLNKQYKEEIFQLSSRTGQLSHELSQQSSNNKANQSTINLLNQRFAELESEKEHEAAVAKRLQEASAVLTKEHLQQQLAWQGEKAMLEQELKVSREKANQYQELEAEVERLTQECRMLRLTKAQLREELEECRDQEDHANSCRLMEEKMEELEMNMKNVQIMLQEKVSQLKEQLEKNAKSNLLLKDLYVENAQLMKALQVLEQRQKSTEKKNFILEEKISSLNKIIREITLASQ